MSEKKPSQINSEAVELRKAYTEAFNKSQVAVERQQEQVDASTSWSADTEYILNKVKQEHQQGVATAEDVEHAEKTRDSRFGYLGRRTVALVQEKAAQKANTQPIVHESAEHFQENEAVYRDIAATDAYLDSVQLNVEHPLHNPSQQDEIQQPEPIAITIPKQ